LKVLTSASMKIAEKIAVQKGSSYSELMENAGKGAADKILRLCEVFGKQITILCGKGNNAGDGLVVARHLSQMGANVTVIFLLGKELSPLAEENLTALEEMQVYTWDAEVSEERRLSMVKQSDIIIDAVFGTGFDGELPSECKKFFETANSTDAIRIALDIPSGVNCDTGLFDESSFRADYTYAFAAFKYAHILKMALPFCGHSEIIDIGIEKSDMVTLTDTVTVLTEDLIKEYIPKRTEDSNKGDYGRLLNIGGSLNMSGAVTLSSLAALRCGVGLLQVALPGRIIPIVASKIPECIYLPMPVSNSGSISADGMAALLGAMEKASAILIGCGLSVCDDTQFICEEIIRNSTVPIVIDADGINCVAENPDILKEAKAPIIITPHIKEMSRLSGFSVELIKRRRFDIAAKFAENYNVTVVLKDSNTVIATPKRQIFVNRNGNSGLAKGGSGDVLAGIISSFLAQGTLPLSAANSGVFIHAEAADITEKAMTAYSMLPSDVIDSIPFVLRDLT